MLLVEPSHMPGELPDHLPAGAQQHQQLLDELLGRQGPLFPPLFSFQGLGMLPAKVVGGLAVTHCPHRGQSIRFGRNTLTFPQHGAEGSKRRAACPAKNSEICSLDGVPRIFTAGLPLGLQDRFFFIGARLRRGQIVSIRVVGGLRTVRGGLGAVTQLLTISQELGIEDKLPAASFERPWE